jgi:outer membrane murein-binding lipoprotein Lpp
MIVRTWVIALVVGVGIASGTSAQTPPFDAAQGAPSVSRGAAPGQNAEVNRVKARQQIFMMEGVLERAVQLGVENLRSRVRAVMPADALLQGGAPQVRGFRLEGYGVFFDVEVPALRQSLAWSIRTMNETNAALARDLAAMRAYVQAIPDARARAEFERTLRRVQQQVNPAPQAPLLAAGGGPAISAQSVGAQPVGTRESVTAQSVMPAETVKVEQQLAVDQAVVDDPSDAYTEEVKAAVVDAMIENSGPLVLGDNEWLTVAARDNAPTAPFQSGDPDVVTLVLRVKGSDLSAFRAGRLTLEQVRSRVQIGEF